MIAREKWQIGTVNALELVFKERVRQHGLHGEAMRDLPDGTGPDVEWIPGVEADAEIIQKMFRHEYDRLRGDAEEPSQQLTRMHLIREELAEAFELKGDDPEFLEEITQVAALCVQWMEYKLEGANV